jgi:hypothetical protein
MSEGNEKVVDNGEADSELEAAVQREFGRTPAPPVHVAAPAWLRKASRAEKEASADCVSGLLDPEDVPWWRRPKVDSQRAAWWLERRNVRRQVRLLPAGLGKIVRSARKEDLALELLGEIEVRLEVAAAGLMKAFKNPLTGEHAKYIPAVHRRRLLARLGQDRSFVAGLAGRSNAERRDAHLQRVYRDWPRALPCNVAKIPVPSSGIWVVDSAMGLGTATHLEAKPEGWAVAVAQRFWTRRNCGTDDVSLEGDDHGLMRVLDHGAGPSTMTLALWATAPEWLKVVDEIREGEGPDEPTGERTVDGHTISLGAAPIEVHAPVEVHEVDTIGAMASLPWVTWRSHTLPTKADLERKPLEPPSTDRAPYDYDLVVLQVPPPAEGANHLRNIYKGIGDAANRHLADIGRYGPKRWREALPRLLQAVLARVADSGEAALLLPLGVRTGRCGRFGYRTHPELLAGVDHIIREAGLVVMSDTEVIERNPLAQPFVGTARCPWRSIIARREADV